MTQADDPRARHRALLERGELAPDPEQAKAVEKLQALHDALEAWRPEAGRRRGLFGLGRAKPAAEPPRGLYLWGGVGRGKSMLMDMFFETAPVSPKRRVHFHAFMQEVHAGIREARDQGLRDPIPPVADKVAEGARLLCFDEMQITDIADAMIVGRLFEALFARGVVVVTTSNRHPDDLYRDGLNRQLFLPFIDLIKDRLEVHHLAAGADHRQDRARSDPRYLAPLGPQTQAEMDRIWEDLRDGAPETPLTVEVSGRRETWPRHAGGAVRAGFEDLCGRPLGAADYLALAGAVHSLMIENVPRLSRARNNEAKRFVTLVDALYEAKTRVFLSAEAEPGRLYKEGPGAFEFERTASRLEEMRSESWPPADETTP